jgi:hypothetical protein
MLLGDADISLLWILTPGVILFLGCSALILRQKPAATEENINDDGYKAPLPESVILE